jgi:hypothetical protein
MSKSGRLPCVNPRCHRTGSAEEFGDSDIVCAKCWKLLPQAVRARYKQLRRREKRLLKLIERRIADHDIRPETVAAIEHRLSESFAENWQLIRDYFRLSERPLGLEGFLQEMGL